MPSREAGPGPRSSRAIARSPTPTRSWTSKSTKSSSQRCAARSSTAIPRRAPSPRTCCARRFRRSSFPDTIPRMRPPRRGISKNACRARSTGMSCQTARRRKRHRRGCWSSWTRRPPRPGSALRSGLRNHVCLAAAYWNSIADSRQGGGFMHTPYKILIMGASYGSLLATKLLLAGHTAKLICLPAEADLINKEGARVRMPVKGRDGLVEIDSRKLPGKLSAGGPGGVKPADYDLVALAMQEPQYRSPGVRELLDAVAKAKVPCMSIMNMPPLPYLRRIPGVDAEKCRPCYTDSTVWDSFDPRLMTLCSPDPQAFRRPESDIEAARLDTGSGKIELPVKLKVHDSIFVPLAKWAMLLAGNYRCVQKDGMRPIKDAVHSDLEASRSVYNWVVKLCVSLGANEKDLVPFEKYANAALSLLTPSSAARALANGAPNIERTDRLVQTIAAQKGMRLAAVDQTVALVDGWLEKNRKKAA